MQGVRKLDHEVIPPVAREEASGYDIYVVSKLLLDRVSPDKRSALIAFCNRKKKMIFLIEEHIQYMDDDMLLVVLLHEICHMKNPLATEEECDKYARDRLGDEAYKKAVRFTRELISEIKRQRRIREKPRKNMYDTKVCEE